MNFIPLVAGGLTAALCLGFALPFGKERQYRTTYAVLAGLRTNFASPAKATSLAPVLEAVAVETPKVDGAPLALASNGSAEQVVPVHASLAPARAASPLPGAVQHRNRSARAGKPRVDQPGNIERLVLSTSTVPQPDRTALAGPSPIEGVPLPASRPAPAAQDDSPEGIRDSFEADASKFPLDANQSVDGVLLRLVGLSRARGRYVVKVVVSNRGSADFFVKELAAFAGEDAVLGRSYVRLFVEPGRTVEGHVVFSPQPGAQVKIKLKEDGEKGRVLEIPVRYPF